MLVFNRLVFLKRTLLGVSYCVGFVFLTQCISSPREVETEDLSTVKGDEYHDFISEKKLKNYIKEESEILTPTAGDIPLEVNAGVEKWLSYFTGKGRQHYIRYSQRGAHVRSYIEKTLEEQGLPKDLYYLAMIESGFRTSARSHMGAVGVWQFMRNTGRQYGLTVNFEIDERRDVRRATVAAAGYLKDLHNVFQSWYLAMAAYNAGQSRVMGSIMRANTRDFWTLAKKRSLPKETMNYVPKFIAAAIIGHHPERFGFDLPKDEPITLKTVSVPHRRSMSNVAQILGLKSSDIMKFNPHLLQRRTPKTPSKMYRINIPVGRSVSQSQHASLKRLPISKSSHKYARSGAGGLVTYRVRRGDSLGKIARSHGTSVNSLKKLNSLRKNNIYPGQKLKVYSSASEYTVRRGDSLGLIAKRFGTSVRKLVGLNDLKSKRIYPGQKLNLDAAATKRYKVRRGDNLSLIARKFRTNISKLKQANRLRRNRIYVGQVLTIPMTF